MKNTLEKSLLGLMHNCTVCSKCKEIDLKIKAPF
jgi:hypothetical protein